MNCSKILNMVYEYSGNGSDSELAMPLFSQLQVWLHTIVCPDCAQEIERFEVTKAIMREDFFPSSPALENTIMARITAEEEQEEDIETYAIPGGISTRGWVIAGLIILISMVTAFFGFDFRNVANESGISFMLPMGITIGCVLTTYGAFFIASHLKELSERFGL